MEDRITARIQARIAELEQGKIEAERHLRDICVALGECQALLEPEADLSGEQLGEQQP